VGGEDSEGSAGKIVPEGSKEWVCMFRKCR